MSYNEIDVQAHSETIQAQLVWWNSLCETLFTDIELRAQVAEAVQKRYDGLAKHIAIAVCSDGQTQIDNWREQFIQLQSLLAFMEEKDWF